MSVNKLIATLDNHGYQLSIDGDEIILRGHGKLPDSLVADLREQKQELIIWLTARDKLIQIAGDCDWPIADLLDWYQHDIKDIARLPMPKVRFIVQDYITNYTACRDEPDPKLLTLSREMKP